MKAIVNSRKQSALAIIGISCIFPKAEDAASYWRNIKEGVDAITDVPPSHWAIEDYFDADPDAPDRTYARRGGFIPPVEFDPLEWGVPPSALAATDTAQILGLIVARRALEDAGYGDRTARTFDRSRASVLLGVTGTLELVIPLGARLGHPHWRRALRAAGVDDRTAEDVVRRISDSYVDWQENSFPGLLGNVVAGRIANRLDLGGTNCVVDAACASSLSALHLAALELESGRADLVISGGVDAFNDIFMYMCFSKTPALSKSGDARPFDQRGDGTILGEGLGMVVLKRLADAQRDGDRIYAVVRGLGTSSDGKGTAIYAPSAEGQRAALRRAYENAGITPDSVELVEAHGTGTVVGDATEVAALAAEFRQAGPEGSWCALGSVKSQIGHTKAAAGVASLIKSALALYHKVLPPTIKVDRPIDAAAPGTTPFYVNTVKRPWLPRARHPRRAAISAFGFGGSNFHCVLEEHAPQKLRVDWDGDVQIVALAATNETELRASLAAIGAWGAAGDSNDADNLNSWTTVRAGAQRTRREYRTGTPLRLTLVLSRDGNTPADAAARAARLLAERGTRAAWSSPEGIYFGTGPALGKLAFVFPGQGSQYTGMMRDLACAFPAMQNALTAADTAFWEGSDPRAERARLSDAIYPHPAFSAEERERAEIALRATEIAQPALGAVSAGALHVLGRFGVQANAVCGHSFGELTALWASGRIAEQTFHTLANFRGRLMGARRGDRGAMVAVAAPAALVGDLLRTEQLDLVIANKNAPDQVVVSGRTAQIERAEQIFKVRGLRAVRLPVAAAFHSDLVADAGRPFREALRKVRFADERCAVFANTTAERYPSAAAKARELLAEQLLHPVEFVAEIENMFHFGVRTFVEVGPGARLTGLIDSILAAEIHSALAIDASSGKRGGMADLARALAQVAALGHEVELARWDEDFAPAAPVDAARRRMIVKVGGNNPRPERPATAAAAAAAAAAPLLSIPAGEATAGTAREEHLAFLAQMQEETARLHQRFLDTQLAALSAFEALATGATISMSAPSANAPVDSAQPLAPAAPAAREPEQLPTEAEHATARDTLLEVVASKTGYPAEILNLDMQLDADLGIDSIKRVEILSALQERLPQSAPVRPERLGEIRTLGDILAGLDATVKRAAGSSPAAAPQRANAPAPAHAAVPVVADRAALLLQVVAEKTGYPAEILNLEMALDADLGIDSIKRVEVLSALQERLPQAAPVRPEQLAEIRTLADIVRALGGAATLRLEASAVTAEVSPILPPGGGSLRRSILEVQPLDAGTPRAALALPHRSLVWIADDGAGIAEELAELLTARGLSPRLVSIKGARRLKTPERLDALIIISPPLAGDDDFARDALTLAQAAAPGLLAAATDGSALFATVSRLDGSFGIDAATRIANPLSGALAGLAKTAAREWPAVTCRALDLGGDYEDAKAAARALADEVFRKAPLEVGLSAMGRRSLALVPQVLDARSLHAPFAAADVVLVTGGARGITAEACVALAREVPATYVLMGRTPFAAEEPSWLRGITEEAAIKQAILGRAGRRMSVRALRDEFQRTSAEREIRATVARVAACGARAHYYAIDITDAAEVARAVLEITAAHGAIRVFVHGAGVLADQKIVEKSDEAFQRVYSTKIHGARNVLAALGKEDLRALVFFSSSTARFGRVGQVDYAMANEALNKIAQDEARRRPACRVLALNWGPWDGGMVTPPLRDLFLREGIGLIPLADGARQAVAEVSHSGAVEVVLLGETAADASTGLGAARNSYAAANKAEPPAAAQSAATPAASVGADSELPVAFARRIDLASCPFLQSHVLDGRAVLPMAMMIEWLAQGAMHTCPGVAFHGFDEMRVFKGVVLERQEGEEIRVHAGNAEARDGTLRVPAELRGTTPDGRAVLHARATIVLAETLPRAKPHQTPLLDAPFPRTIDELYRERLFHGPDLQGLISVDGCSGEGIAGKSRGAPAPSRWIARPLRNRWLADPLVLDVSFQLMIVWSLEQMAAGSLPCFAGSYRQYQRTFPRDRTRIVIEVTRSTEHSAFANIEYVDDRGGLIARLTDYECIVDASLGSAFRSNQLVS